jgi:hypothetical protein
MQLTILLALIYTRGPSLPEKRTSMYDTYMDLFFSREAEKSDIAKDHRDLLIDIHRYLAWKLQTAAEAGGNGVLNMGISAKRFYYTSIHKGRVLQLWVSYLMELSNA